MDCTQARELMWEKDLSEEFFRHIESCPECKSEYELVKKTKTALSSKDNVTERILVAAMLDKHRRTALRITRIAAAVLVVFAVGIFAKLALDSGMKTAEDRAENFAPTLDYKAESSVGTTNNGFSGLFDGASRDECFETEELLPSYDSCDKVTDDVDLSAKEPSESKPEEDAVEESPVTESDTVYADDVGMLMNVYKDMHSLSYHTADIIVSGGDLSGVCDTLFELGAQKVDFHVEINGDFYFEAQELLALAGFDILYVSSSESVNKTLIYFEDLMK